MTTIRKRSFISKLLEGAGESIENGIMRGPIPSHYPGIVNDPAPTSNQTFSEHAVREMLSQKPEQVREVLNVERGRSIASKAVINLMNEEAALINRLAADLERLRQTRTALDAFNSAFNILNEYTPADEPKSSEIDAQVVDELAKTLSTA